MEQARSFGAWQVVCYWWVCFGPWLESAGFVCSYLCPCVTGPVSTPMEQLLLRSSVMVAVGGRLLVLVGWWLDVELLHLPAVVWVVELQ